MKKHMNSVTQHCANGGGAVYGLGLIGAAFYYITHAASFSAGLVGLVKAIFWPAFFVYKAIEMWQF